MGHVAHVVRAQTRQTPTALPQFVAVASSVLRVEELPEFLTSGFKSGPIPRGLAPGRLEIGP